MKQEEDKRQKEALPFKRQMAYNKDEHIQ